jgi:hypothetical protein
MGVSVSREYEEGNWQDLREQQQLLITDDNVPNLGMAVTIDTNEDPNNTDESIRMHPHNKKPVGERLAQVALQKTYHMNIVGESPVLDHYRISNDSIYLIFKNQGAGLKIKTGDTKLDGFVIAGSDKVFKSGNAEIINDSTISINSSLVSQPVAVRYAWSKNPLCNLYNSVDFPASPFRTDIWPSGYTYSTFASTCTSSNDAGLLSIRLNGLKLAEFAPNKLSYTLGSNELQQIKAITNSPFATVSVAQATEQNGRKATLTVTAEDKSVKTYEVIFSNLTSNNQIQDNNISVSVQNRDLILDIKDNITGNYRIYDCMGQCIANNNLRYNSKNEYVFKHSGIYFIHLNTSKGESELKFIIK